MDTYSKEPSLRHHEWLDEHTLELQLAHCVLRISFLNEYVIRCNYSTEEYFDKKVSYGVSPKYQCSPLKLHEEDNVHYLEICSEKLKLRIRRRDGGIEFYDSKDEILSADAEGYGHRHEEHTGNEIVWMEKQMPIEAHFFGMGDKPCALNLRGKRFNMWCADYYQFHSESDPLYKSIPFYICLNKGLSHGIFFDNTTRSYFDFGHTRPDRITFGSDGGGMDYYFIGGDNALEVVQNYTRLTGLPDMPPLWSLGYHQSRWSYATRNRVEQLADKLRRHKLPCDSIHLDIAHMKDYQSLTWDHTAFPEPKEMIAGLEEKGIKTVCIINPGIKINPDNYIWRSGFEHNVFCRRHDGTLLTGKVWPKLCNFPDFTAPSTRNWWASLFKRQISEYAVRGIWVDMNEPVIIPNKTFPEDVRHDYDGIGCSHSKAHNIYGQCMAEASKQGMEEYAPERRPFVLSRAGYAGLQRHAATWTGDNASSWAHLKMANIMVQRLSFSGVSFCGSDTGGFLGNPDPELFCRWMQLSAFHPFYRSHCSGEYISREPWCFGEKIEDHIRHALEERYRLLPYFYSQFQRYSSEGLPIVRALCLVHSDQSDSYWRSSEFYCGDSLYIVPVHHKEESKRRLYAPPGSWYSLWDDSPAPCADKDCWVDTPMRHIPVFVRAGQILPRWPIQQYVGEQENPLIHWELWWSAHSEENSQHYEDQGDGKGYLQGDYLLHRFHYQSEENSFTLRQQCEGERLPAREQNKLILHALPAAAELFLCIDGGEECRYSVDEKGILSLPIAANFQIVQARIIPR